MVIKRSLQRNYASNQIWGKCGEELGHSIIVIKPNSACRGLAGSHERFIAWGIELPQLNKVCIMGKPRTHLSVLIKPLFSPISLLEDLAISNDRMVAWGIRLPIQGNIRTTGKPEGLKRCVFEVKDEILIAFVNSQGQFREEF